MKIITSVVNNPTFIVLQYHLLKKFFQHDFEYIVFNDAKDFPDYSNFQDITIKKEIEDTCKLLNVKCINIDNDHHKTVLDACLRCSDAMNFMLKYQLMNPDKYLIIDSDMFLIDYFNPEKYFNYDCAFVLQQRYNCNYMWNGFVYFDMFKMKNLSFLNWDHMDGTDVGGKMSHWINIWLQDGNHKLYNTEHIRYIENDNIQIDDILFIRHLWSHTWDENDLPNNLSNNNTIKDFFKNDVRKKILGCDKNICEIYDKCFLHLREGGNWTKQSRTNHIYCTQRLMNTVYKLLHDI
jgi:hypothetical protein